MEGLIALGGKTELRILRLFQDLVRLCVLQRSKPTRIDLGNCELTIQCFFKILVVYKDNQLRNPVKFLKADLQPFHFIDFKNLELKY